MIDQTLERRVAALERKENRRGIFDRQEQLRRDGYKPFLNRIDAQVAAESSCESCGAKGLMCSGLATDEPEWSYIAFAECRRCGHWVEI